MADNGKSTIWRGTVGVLIGLLCFLSSFVFYKVVALPEVYINKTDNKEMHQVHRDRIDRVESEIQQGFREIREQYIEINQYLRDNADKKERDGG